MTKKKQNQDLKAAVADHKIKLEFLKAPRTAHHSSEGSRVMTQKKRNHDLKAAVADHEISLHF